jgi:hypothetical protein
MGHAGIYSSRDGFTGHMGDAVSPGLLTETLPGPDETSDGEEGGEKRRRILRRMGRR